MIVQEPACTATRYSQNGITRPPRNLRAHNSPRLGEFFYNLARLGYNLDNDPRFGRRIDDVYCP
jgi:hypothetical protein